jgi:hypothetical protein
MDFDPSVINGGAKPTPKIYLLSSSNLLSKKLSLYSLLEFGHQLN